MSYELPISNPPHDPASFALGEFIFDPDVPWDQLRSAIVFEKADTKWFWVPRIEANEFKKPPHEAEIQKYPGRLATHILAESANKWKPDLDTAPWLHTRSQILEILRDAPGRRLQIERLIDTARNIPKIRSELVEDTLRMMVIQGLANISLTNKGKLLCSLSQHMTENYSRIDYLATFSDELITKSRRIDHLIGHSGTVGNYREELLRALLSKMIPSQYEISTGFIDGCPRQLDIIIWDKHNYAPLFRESNVVVVPRSSVRAVIEVKTRLNTNSLDEALHILWDTFRVHQTVAPIFKGIFAYEAGYMKEQKVANRIRRFYSAYERDGIIDHRHRYTFSGITAVCVPRHCFIRETYRIPDDETAFPQPWLSAIKSKWPRDTQTALFIGMLMMHLDLPASKAELARIFDPILGHMEEVDLGPVYRDSWAPCMSLTQLSKTLDAEGARAYVTRARMFGEGELAAADIGNGLAGEED